METLRRIRERSGLSQPELSEISGVAQGTISDIELGKRKPRGRTLRKLAQALGVQVADLLGEGENLKVEAPPPEPTLFNGLEDERRIATIRGLEEEIRHFTGEWRQQLKNARDQNRYWCAGVQTMAAGYTDIILRLDLLRKVRGINKLDKQARRQKFIDSMADEEFRAAMELMEAWAYMHKAADEVEKAADVLWGDWLVREEAEQRRKAFSVIQGEMTA